VQRTLTWDVCCLLVLFPQDVARCLATIGIPYALKIISEDGLLALGLALPDRYKGLRGAKQVYNAAVNCVE
jgi:hypothetical protein